MIVCYVDKGLVNVALTSRLFYEPAMDTGRTTKIDNILTSTSLSMAFCVATPRSRLPSPTCWSCCVMTIFSSSSTFHVSFSLELDSRCLLNHGKYTQGLRELRILVPIDLDEEEEKTAASQALYSLNDIGATPKWNGPIPEAPLAHLAKLRSFTSLTHTVFTFSYNNLLAHNQSSFSSLHRVVLQVSAQHVGRATSFLAAICLRLLVQLEISPG